MTTQPAHRFDEHRGAGRVLARSRGGDRRRADASSEQRSAGRVRMARFGGLRRQAAAGRVRTARFGGLRRWAAAGLGAVLLAGSAGVAVPAAGAQSRSVGTVVIANGWSSADSAVASALAAARNSGSSPAVVLYSTAKELSARTRSFIDARDPASVVLVGGTKALSSKVADAVAGLTGSAPQRITGGDRYETAANAVPQTASVFIVANGHSPADTGVAAALAAVTRNAAVLLSSAKSLTSATEKVISERKPRQVIFVGGAKVLPEALEARVAELAPSAGPVTRRSGASRTDTAASAVPSWATTLVVANGWSPADTSVAAALAAITPSAGVLYSERNRLTGPTSDRIADLQPAQVVLVGGEKALAASLHRSVHCLAPGAEVRRVSGSDRIDTAVRAASGLKTLVNTDFDCGAGGGGGGGGGGGAGSGGSGGNGPGAPAAQAPNAPEAPSLELRAKSLKVTWKTPADNGSDITDYDVQYRACTATDKSCATSPLWGSWFELAHTGTARTATITGLDNGTTYEVQVRARSSARMSKWSASASGAPEDTPERPVAPTVDQDSQSLNVSWTAPFHNGSPISGYKVRYAACTATPLDCTSSPTWETWQSHSHSGTGRTAAISGLTVGTKYRVQVQATNDLGDSSWSPSGFGTPGDLRPSAPSQPGATGGDKHLSVTWNKPEDNGFAITQYEVKYRACTATPLDCTSSPAWGSWQSHSHSGTGTTATITGLTNSTAYQVKVRAKNSKGFGSWSPPSGSVVPVGPVPNTPSAPTVTSADESLSVRWTAPSGNNYPITDYDVKYRPCTATNKSCSSSPKWGDWTSHTHTGTGTTATISSLTNGTAYQVQVLAKNTNGDSAWSASGSAVPKDEPGAPSAPTVTAAAGSLSVQWSAPSDTGGAAITDYDVQYRACTKTADLTCSSSPTWGSWSSHAHTGTGTTANITTLTNGTAYQVQVRATNSVGTGPWSASSASAAPKGKPDAPSAPSTAPTTASLGVSWTAPAANGAAITDYDVQYRACTKSADLSCSSSPTWGSWTTLSGSDDPGTDTKATITGLTNGTKYQAQVRATNSVGTGAWSASGEGVPYNNPTLAQNLHDPAPYPGANPTYDYNLKAPAITNIDYNPELWPWTNRVWKLESDNTKTNETTGVGDSAANFCLHVGGPTGDACDWYLNWAMYTCQQIKAGVTAGVTKETFTSTLLNQMTWASGRPNGTERQVRKAIAAGVRTCTTSPQSAPVASIWDFDTGPDSHWVTEVTKKEA